MSLPQGQLFGPAASLPEGFVLLPDFIAPEEERGLLEAIAQLPLEPARYKQYTARRRIALFDPASGQDLPKFLEPLRIKVAAWMGVPSEKLGHALVNEYRPGTPLGWHRDAPDYERVAGVSLGGWARMRLRPYPAQKKSAVVDLQLAPRSGYRIEGPARWAWQHSIVATKELRYSITFRTFRG